MVLAVLTNITVVLFILSIAASATAQSFNDTGIHRIKREVEDSTRYLVFPQGSNVQLIYCMTIGTYAKPATFFTIGVTAGLAWELPHANNLPYRKPAEVYHRRSRRDLYRKVEIMLSTRGKDGKACVRKAICQAGQRNGSEVGKGSFMQEIIHTIFTLPDGSYDVDPITEYEQTYQSSSKEDCEKKYSTCPDLF